MKKRQSCTELRKNNQKTVCRERKNCQWRESHRVYSLKLPSWYRTSPL